MSPLTSGCTYEGPAKEVYHQVKLLAQGPGIAGPSFACGLCPADFAGDGASLVAYATSREAADRAADSLLQAAVERESALALGALQPAEAVPEARRIDAQAATTVGPAA